MRIGLITISDTRCFEDDETGKAVSDALRQYGFDSFENVIIAGELTQIRHALRHMSERCSVILTMGGTGFSPEDVTPEATANVLDRRADNLCELIRMRCGDHEPSAHLSRGIAGMIGDSLVVNLPGSPESAKRAVHAVGNLLPELVRQMRCGDRAGTRC